MANRVNAFNLADEYLRTLGWPSTPATRRVLAAWFMRESARAPGSKTDILVVGNNPLNITCTSCSNYRLAGGGTVKVVTYDSTASGISAFKGLIGGHGPGYSGIVSTFKNQSDNPSSLITSINKSGWVTGKTNSYIYRNNGRVTNGLESTYNSIGGGDIGPILGPPSNPPKLPPIKANGEAIIPIPSNRIADTGACPIGYNRATYDPGLDPVGFFTHLLGGGIVDIHSLKANEANICLANGFGEGNLAIQKIGAGAGDVGGAVAPGLNLGLNVFGALTGKAAAVGAILAGIALIGFGGYLISKDVYSGGGGGMLDVTPIILRE